jgi:hypothetical protein
MDEKNHNLLILLGLSVTNFNVTVHLMIKKCGTSKKSLEPVKKLWNDA